MKKLLLPLVAILSAAKALAVCPLCTVAVAGGAVFLREYGIDDTITGVWYGALVMSSALWLISWLDKKQYDFRFKRTISLVGMYGLLVAPLYFTRILLQPQNMVWGVDKMIWGVLLGSVVFALSVWSDHRLRHINEGHVVVHYQKVIIPVVYLALVSAALEFILTIV